MKAIAFLFFFLPLFACAGFRKDSFIHKPSYEVKFENGRWSEIIRKAKKAKKYIFVDCYTTWCGPCKLMEKDIFPTPKVSEQLDRNFISVRLQMDRTKGDDDKTKNRYPDADLLQQKYGVPVFPTYLVFSPEGELISRGAGYKPADEFVAFLDKSIDPNSPRLYLKYYALLSDYQSGKKDYSILPSLIDTAIMLQQGDLVESLSKDYIGYLKGLSKDELYTKQHLSFLASYIQSSKSRFFSVFYGNEDRVNTAMQKKGYAQSIVGQIISGEEIDSMAHFSGGMASSAVSAEMEEPDWDQLNRTISQKYTADYAEENIMKAKVRWYSDQRRWLDSAKWFTLLVKKYSMEANDEGKDMGANGICWGIIFKWSVDKEQIDAAIDCMKDVVERQKQRKGAPFTFQDTYANLLYKAGRVAEAIVIEKEAIQTCLDFQQPENYIKEYRDVLKKMENRQPTWPHYIDREDVFGPGLIEIENRKQTPTSK